jgi:transposase
LEHGVPGAIVNPGGVRDFAKAMGRLEKTDRIDAGVIAWFAQTKDVKPIPLASDVQARLKALVTRLRQLTEHRGVHVQQRELVAEPFVRPASTSLWRCWLARCALSRSRSPI